MANAQHTAETLNAHLTAGGSIQIATMTRIVKYTKRHAGYFKQGEDGNLYVTAGFSRKTGKARFDCLTHSKGQVLLVGIRLNYTAKDLARATKADLEG